MFKVIDVILFIALVPRFKRSNIRPVLGLMQLLSYVF